MTWTSGTATGHEDLLEKFRRWITGYGTAAAAVANGGNTGNGTVTGIDTTPATITETWTLTCTAGGPTGTFSVVGSVSGAEADATVGTAYSNDFISFLINDGAADFIIGDSFTIAATIGAMSDDGFAWEEQAGLTSEVLVGAAWSRSSTNFTVTLTAHTLDVGDTVDISAISTTGLADATKTIASKAANTITFTGSDTKSSLSWTRSGSTATVTWNGHGFSTGNNMTVSASSATGTISNGSKSLTVVDANTFTFSCTNSGVTSGTLTGTLPTSGTMTISLDEEHVYLKGLGNGGTDEIFVNLRAYRNVGAGYYNVELRGATGFVPSSARTAQPGISSNTDLCLWSSTIPYWFIANGRRFMIVAKVGTVYQSAYCGFILPTGLPSEYPYPLAIGGTQSVTRKKYDYSSAAYSHRAFFNPGGGLGEDGALYLLEKSGAWSTFKNYSADNSIYSGNYYRTFPYAASLHSPSSADKPIYPNIDGTYTLFPVTLLGRVSTSVENIFGDFEGVFYVSGQGNASENIVQIDGIDHLVVQSAFRSDVGNYAAFALE